jgi:hypothetical protein
MVKYLPSDCELEGEYRCLFSDSVFRETCEQRRGAGTQRLYRFSLRPRNSRKNQKNTPDYNACDTNRNDKRGIHAGTFRRIPPADQVLIAAPDPG